MWVAHPVHKKISEMNMIHVEQEYNRSSLILSLSLLWTDMCCGRDFVFTVF